MGAAACALALILAGCGAQPFSVAGAARSTLQRAARRTLAERTATMNGVETARGSVVVRFAGDVDFAADSADVVTTTVGSDLPPFDGRWVGGWTYLQMPRGQLRPPTIPRSVQWLAFHVRRFRGAIPVPAPTIYPGLPTQMLDDLVNGDYSVEPVASPDRSLESYRVSRIDGATRGATVLLRAGRVVGFDTTGSGDPVLKFTFVHYGEDVRVMPPAASHTRVIPAGANLYERARTA